MFGFLFFFLIESLEGLILNGKNFSIIDAYQYSVYGAKLQRQTFSPRMPGRICEEDASVGLWE